MEKQILENYYVNVAVETKNTYRAQLPNTGHEVKIMFVTEAYVQSSEYEEYVKEIYNAYYIPLEESLPIILIKDYSYCSMLAYPVGEVMHLNVKMKWFELNAVNIETLNCVAEAAYSHVCILPTEKIGIIREIAAITIDSKLLTFRYFREFDKEYKMKSIVDRNNITRLVHRTPEEEYPYDFLDYVLISEIKSRYPNIQTSSHILLVNTTLKNEQLNKQYPHEFVNCNIIPMIQSPSKIVSPLNTKETIVIEVYSLNKRAIETIKDTEWNIYNNIASDYTQYNDIIQQIKRYKQYSSVFI